MLTVAAHFISARWKHHGRLVTETKGNRCVFVCFSLFMAGSICRRCYAMDKHEAVCCTLHTVILETAGNLLSVDRGARFTLSLLSIKPVSLLPS